jgi:hypothetical protein
MTDYRSQIRELVILAHVDLGKIIKEETPKTEAIEAIINRLVAIVEVSKTINEANRNRVNAIRKIENALEKANSLTNAKVIVVEEKEFAVDPEIDST